MGLMSFPVCLYFLWGRCLRGRGWELALNANVLHRDLEITLEISYKKSENKHSFWAFDDVGVVKWSHSLGFLGPADAGAVHRFTDGAAVRWACASFGSQMPGPISSPPKSTCRGPVKNGQLALSLGRAGQVFAGLLGQAMPCGSDASDEESPGCTLRAQIREGPLAAALSPSLWRFISLRRFLESATGSRQCSPSSP